MSEGRGPKGPLSGEIARLLRVHETTVGRWVRDYLRFGFEGLEVGKSPGRPRRIDAEGEAALREALEHNPRDLGYAFTRWTRDTLAEYLYAAVHIRSRAGRSAVRCTNWTIATSGPS